MTNSKNREEKQARKIRYSIKGWHTKETQRKVLEQMKKTKKLKYWNFFINYA